MQTGQSNEESSTNTAPNDEFEAFEMALRTLSERVRTDDAFAHDLYGALCNMRWLRQDAATEPVSMSWRYAGGVVSHLACKGGYYLDYYCSGNEGVVSARIQDALGALGWTPAPWPEDGGASFKTLPTAKAVQGTDTSTARSSRQPRT